MIDTLMAFWNQNRRRRAGQVLLTFFLMCISISLLFVAMSLPQWSHTHPQGSITGKAGNKGSIEAGARVTPPTVVVQITQGPQTKPTSTVIVPSQATPTPSGSASSCTTPDAQVNVNATTSTNVAPLQVTPYVPKMPTTQATSPIVHSSTTPTPLPTTVATVTVEATATSTPSASPTATQPITPTATETATPATTPTVTGTNGTPPPVSPQQQDGGGPLNDGTPVSASPVPGSTPPGSTQHIGGGWISA